MTIWILRAGVYILSTAYGAFALREFLGKECVIYTFLSIFDLTNSNSRMYDLVLTDDPSKLYPHGVYVNSSEFS
jgi:hypothetical protein